MRNRREQVDADEKTDHPKPRDRPLRENEEAEQKCNRPVQRLPSPAGKVTTNEPIS